MFVSHLRVLQQRRTVVVAIAAIAAILMTLALTLEPPSATTGDPGAAGESIGHSGGVVTTTIPGDGDASIADDADSGRSLGPEGGSFDATGEKVAPATGSPEPAIAPEAGVDAGGASTLALPDLDARIVRSGHVELRVKRSGFEDAWSEAQAVAAAHGGYVVAASRSGAGDGPRSGSITMRIPTKRFDSAVDRLRDVSGAKVRRLDVTSQDVTQEFVDVRSRLRHDRAVEARLLALLSQTRGVGEVLTVQTRLDDVQEQIELSKGRLGYLEKMTSMSTVESVITAPAAPGGRDEADDDDGVLAASLADARDRFEGNVAGAIVWFGGALPALVLLALIALVVRATWRRTQSRTVRDAPEKSL